MRLDRITENIEQYADDSWQAGYHVGFDEAWEECSLRDEPEEVEPTLWVSFKGRDSRDYKFTTTDRNHESLQELRASIAAGNDSITALLNGDNYPSKYKPNDYGTQPWDTPNWLQLKRVRLMPRGPRVAPALADGQHPTAYYSYLPMKHASHYDVYITRKG